MADHRHLDCDAPMREVDRLGKLHLFGDGSKRIQVGGNVFLEKQLQAQEKNKYFFEEKA